MKAAVKTRPEPGFLEVIDYPIPHPKPGEVLVRVRASGMCGTDVLLYDWTYEGRKPVVPPVIIGHEASGEIVEVGSGVDHLQIGARVSMEAIIGCGQCYYCRSGYKNLCPNWAHLGISFDGTFAEYVACPAEGVHVLPDSVSWEEGALLEPISIVVHALERTPVAPGDKVVVIGPGPMGLLVLQAAKAAGASVVVCGTKGDEPRLSLARTLGADYTCSIDEIDALEYVRSLTHGLGADVVFEAAGTAAGVQDALAMVRGMGRVMILGFAKEALVKPLHIARQGLRIDGVVASVSRHFETAVRWLEDKIIRTEPLISHRLALEDVVEGIRLMKEKAATKVLFTI